MRHPTTRRVTGLEAGVGDPALRPGWLVINMVTGYAAAGSMVILCPRASSSRMSRRFRASGLSVRRVK